VHLYFSPTHLNSDVDQILNDISFYNLEHFFFDPEESDSVKYRGASHLLSVISRAAPTKPTKLAHTPQHTTEDVRKRTPR
jgi:hypothetical protein